MCSPIRQSSNVNKDLNQSQEETAGQHQIQSVCFCLKLSRDSWQSIAGVLIRVRTWYGLVPLNFSSLISSSAGKTRTMGDWSALKKCCYCISLTIGTKAIASFFLLLTLGKPGNVRRWWCKPPSFLPGLFSLYLVKLKEVRAYILEDIYGISPCTMAPLDSLIDSCFEYSILVNLGRCTSRVPRLS